jgi:hypothetical protein
VVGLEPLPLFLPDLGLPLFLDSGDLAFSGDFALGLLDRASLLPFLPAFSGLVDAFSAASAAAAFSAASFSSAAFKWNKTNLDLAAKQKA